MKSTQKIALCILAAMILCSGCAIVSSHRKRSGNSETHTVAILGLLPIWHSEYPVEKDEKPSDKR